MEELKTTIIQSIDNAFEKVKNDAVNDLIKKMSEPQTKYEYDFIQRDEIISAITEFLEWLKTRKYCKDGIYGLYW